MFSRPTLGLRCLLTRNKNLCKESQVVIDIKFVRGAPVSVNSYHSQCLRPYVDPKLSYAFGKSNDSLVYNSIARQLEDQCRLGPDKLAFVSHYEGKQVTMAQFTIDVNRLANTLITKLNISKGDNVAIYSYNCYNWLVIQFACIRIGAILTPINPSNKADELSYILETGNIKCLFTQGPKSVQAELNNHLATLKSEKISALIQANKLKLEHVVLMDSENNYDGLLELPTYKISNSIKLTQWQNTQDNGQVYGSLAEAEQAGLTESSAIIVDPSSICPDDPFAIYYTSGTTGKPKGACVSHFAALNNARFVLSRFRHGRPKSWEPMLVTMLPLYHIFAGVLCSFYPLMGSGAVIFPGYKYNIGQLVESLIKYQCTLIALTPTILIDMLAYIDVNKLNSQIPLRIVQSGGAPLPPQIVKRAYKLLPQLEEVRVGYGSTENGAVATLQTMHEPGETKATSVGPPLDFTEVRVAQVVKGSREGKTMPLGEQGEIQTRGHNVMIEYLNEPDKTASVITPNRWYRTGDIGFMHPHGSIEMSGRIKNLIIRGGENIYPQEIERVILQMKQVEDVHVIGVPDSRFGEQVCAWVKLKADFKPIGQTISAGSESCPTSATGEPVTDEQVIEFCKERLTYFKVPRYVFFADNFPMTPTKKAQKHIMTELACKKLGIDQSKQ